MKPRIWDNKKRKYIDSLDSVYDYLLEENTGLKDADGYDIYENDIWMRTAPIYRNGKLEHGAAGRCGYLLIFRTEDGRWSIEEEDCLPNNGEVVGTIHDIDNI